MNKEKKQLSVEEAKAQGYTHFFYTNDGQQPLNDINDIDEDDLMRGIELVEKDPSGINPITSDDISELVNDFIINEHGEDMEIEDLLKDVDYSEVVKQINECLKSAPYYRSTGIAIKK